MTNKSTESGWEYLLELAESKNRDYRQTALIRSYSWIEHALGACGLARDGKIKSISQLLHIAHEQGLLTPDILLSNVKDAVEIRHKAAHVDSVPSPDMCKSAVKILKDAWYSLRKSQITLSNAADISRKIVHIPGIRSVNLYGSLARKASTPKDFDLLVFDDGRYSNEIDEKDLGYIDRVKITRKSLELLGLGYAPRMDSLAKCRWIDVTILNGDLFGKDYDYTSDIATFQPDSYFFLNIASDIKQYDIKLHSFVTNEMDIFISLRKIYNMLRELGF